MDRSETVKVSIILPSLNVAGYIEEAITSARDQSLSEIEIICVDAGSNDGTCEIVEQQASLDDRIVVINSPVRSYGYQVNAGIDAAHGEYIAILETDDYVDRQMYESLYDLASSQDYDYVKCDYDTYAEDENGDRVFVTRSVGRNRVMYESPFNPLEYPEIAFDDWYLWNGIYRADFLKKENIRFSETPGAAFQDIGFLHKTTSRASSVRYLDRSLYRYCVSRPEASSRSDRTLIFIRQEYALIADDMEPKLLYRRMAKSFTRACMDCSDAFICSEEANVIIRWFRDKLVKAQHDGYVSSEMLPAGLRRTYEVLIDPKKDYTEYRLEKARQMRDFLGEGHPVVIFGCGNYGRDALEYIRTLGCIVTSFMDNSDDLWGRSIGSITVESPDKMRTLPDGTRYVVANENHADEIVSQIREFADSERILIY